VISFAGSRQKYIGWTELIQNKEQEMATTTTAPIPKPKSTIIKLKINFELNTPNGLRRVIFGLEKDSTSGNVVEWNINFQLFERAKRTDPYTDPLVSLQVEVDKALFPKAEKASQGLTPGQSAHALGPAADDAKAAADGEIDEEDAQDTIQNTLKKK
jgi:hypothetical protein